MPQLPLTIQGGGFEIGDIFASPYFWVFIILAAVVLVFLAALFILRAVLRYRTSMNAAFKKVILLIKVPKELPEGEKHEETSAKIQEEIGLAEILWSAVGGLKSQAGFKAWLLGRSDHLSLEIVADKGLIVFYFAAPQYLREFVEEQIMSQYPRAEIEEVEDYNIFSAQGFISSAYLVLRRSSIFPIKTYRKTGSDSLSSLTNALAKINKDDGAAIQVIIRSATPVWRKLGVKVARAMQQGKKLSEAMPKFSFGVLFSDLFKAISAKPKEKAPETPYKLSPLEEEMVKGLEEKASKAGLDVNLRLVASSKTKEQAEMYLNNIIGAFGQFNIYEYGNAFKTVKMSGGKIIRDFIYRNFDEGRGFVLNTEELASIYHLPSHGIETPNILWLLARNVPVPLNIPTEGLILGRNVYRGAETWIRMDREARRRHLYAIGQTGTGKSTFFQELIKQDILAGEGVCVIDPHGDLVEDVIQCIPKERVDDVIYYNPADIERPMGLNLLEYDEKYPEQKTFVINEMINIFDKLYDLRQTGGPMFELYMRNAMLLVMEHPESGSTLMEIPKVLADADFRHYKLEHCQNEVVSHFWLKEAEKAGGEAALSNMTPYITSKLTPFISNDIMRPIIAQQKSAFNLREIMDKRKIFLLNLSKGKLGEANAFLLGMVLVGKIWAAALSRAEIPAEERADFFVYIDEFQNFMTDTIVSILSEARKYRLCLNLTHQFIGQLVRANDTKIRDAVFGNVGTQVAFRIGPEDAEFMAKQFAPIFSAHDLMNFSNFTAAIKLLVAGQISRPFNMEVYRYWEPWSAEAEKIWGAKRDTQMAQAVKDLSRLKYGKNRDIVEAEIKERGQTS